MMLNNFWYACEFSHLVTSKPRRITLFNQAIVLYRNALGQVVALNDRCPHRGAALSLGTVEQDCIQCPYHGWEFRSDGACIEIPGNQPGIPIPPKAHIDSYFVQEKYGFVWVFWGKLSPEDAPPLPLLPDFPDSSWRPIYIDLTLDAHYGRLLENLTDPVHTSFVHANSFGSGMIYEPQSLANDEVVLEAWGARSLLISKQPTPKKGFYWKYIYSRTQQEVRVKTSFQMPNILLQRIDFKFSLAECICLVPISETKTAIKLICFRNFLTHPWADGLFRKLNLKILQEDRTIVESQQPQVISSDLSAELHVAGDALSVAYRKLLKKCFDMGWIVDPDRQTKRETVRK
ncbi:MAG: aromatic ring-hydroxylating dioxygenase subunit alpha [Thermosynechococcaceae cyanobacterium]